MIKQRASRILVACTCLALASLLLACVTLPWQASQGMTAVAIPRWACPTPTPKPYGEAGPLKGYEDGAPDPTTGIPEQKPVYYQEWEQEDFDGSDAPFPAPTPYTKTGSNFYMGQLVNLTQQLDVRADVQRTDMLSGSLRLYEARLEWKNRGQPFIFSLARQVVISAIQRPDGARVGGNGWSWSLDAAQRAGREHDPIVLRSEVPTGASEVIAPIFAPDGEVQTVDLWLDLPGSGGDVETGGLRIQWLRAHEPNCGQDGTEAASYDRSSQPVQGAPPAANASDVISFASSQVGRPYCWGGKGWDNCDGYGGGPKQVTPSCTAQGGAPCWDCSGLTWGAYKAVGVTIGHGTGNQSQYPAVWRPGDPSDPESVAQPGDLLLFTGANANGRPAGSITHVGIYAGNGLMIHAANYPDGVIETPNVFHNRYYGVRLAVITRPPQK